MAKNNLNEYSAKRSFAATPEPPPAVTAPGSGPLLFVVQQHSARRMHYDFRLECDGVLKSWAVPKGPSVDPNEKRLAVQVEDHPYDYASFEGVIPPGQYGAGEVIVWDCGVYSPDEGGAIWFHDRGQAEREVREGLNKGKLSIQLRGEKLKGSFALVRTKDAKQWLLIKHKDRFAAATDVTAQNRSVLSGVAVEELTVVPVQRISASQLVPSGEIEAMPAKLEPMHAEPGDMAFNRADWMWEPKLDGYRVLAFVDGHGVKLRSRRGRGGQTQGQSLRGRPALCIVAESETNAQCRFRRRRLHQGERVTRAARRDSRRLLGQGRAPLRIARRLRLRREHAQAVEGEVGSAAKKQLPIRGEARAQCAHDLGRARRRRRSVFSELDR